MAEKTKTLLNSVVFNKLTKQQYKQAQEDGEISENEFYMIGDILGDGDMSKDVYDTNGDGVVNKADSATKLTTARKIGGASFDGTKNISTYEILKSTTVTSSGATNTGKFIKFATVDCSSSPYTASVGRLLIVDSESSNVNGILFYYFRTGQTIATTSIKLRWETLNSSTYEDCIQAVKVSDGKYDLYFKAVAQYQSIRISIIEAVGLARITFHSGQSYVSPITAAAKSSISSIASTAKKLQSAAAINGVDFDGSADISIPNNYFKQLTGVDLNNQKTFGDYYGAGGNHCTNVPSGVDWFYLRVFKIAGGYIGQLLYANGIIYTRYYGTTVWSEWAENYSSKNKPTPSEIGAAPTTHSHSNYLPLLGGTLTGYLTLNGAPTQNLHAATKKYVDDKIVAAGTGDMLKSVYDTNGDGIVDKADKAATLTTARSIDGVSFNGSANIVHYGTCSTAAGTAAKVVACTGFSLVTGSKIIVKFTVTNTAASPTLNVNNTGAKAIRYRGATINTSYLAANRVYSFVYDGTDYELIGDIDTNTTYSTGTTSTLGLTKLYTGTGTATDGTMTQKAITDLINNNKVYSITVTSNPGQNYLSVKTGTIPSDLSGKYVIINLFKLSDISPSENAIIQNNGKSYFLTNTIYSDYGTPVKAKIRELYDGESLFCYCSGEQENTIELKIINVSTSSFISTDTPNAGEVLITKTTGPTQYASFGSSGYTIGNGANKIPITDSTGAVPKAVLAGTAENANLATNASHASSADTAITATTATNATKLSNKTLSQIVPNYSTSETTMPYTWTNGKAIYRKAEYVPISRFTESITEIKDSETSSHEEYQVTLDNWFPDVTLLLRFEVMLCAEKSNAGWYMPLGCKRNTDTAHWGGGAYVSFDKGGTNTITIHTGQRPKEQYSGFVLIAEYIKS